MNNSLWTTIVIFELMQDIKREKWVLTDEGRSYTVAGSPEVQLFLAIPPDGISREELQVVNLFMSKL